ncbi:amidohydrolase family protein [Paenibacillus thalictri]|uniref:Amidohydrolase n=1 Tax=Paenibacillus thalictri TaxID=2527873 RepID=A0A4Q9DJ01_9BACL|nr:amidohydrolase family protein [Paenibacillus thalictri]TBL73319.1 amidohydrolase [Paenibacillus thalictri]
MHTHFVPERYRQAAGKSSQVSGNKLILPEWNEDMHLEFNDQMGIDTAIVSLSSPFVHLGDDREAVELARIVNERGFELVNKYPDKFGFLAALPVPYVEGALAELDYAVHVLKADGVMLPTNSRGVYLGDPSFEPLLEALNARSSVVFMHPAQPSAIPSNVLAGVPVSMMEFFFDITRAVANLLFTGSFERYPHIRWIMPLGGAALPVLADRMQAAAATMGSHGQDQENKPLDVLGTLRKQHYDLAGLPIPRQIAALRQLVPSSAMMYGSDWPYNKLPGCRNHLDTLMNSGTFTEDELEQLFSSNPLRFFTRLAILYAT